MFLLWTQHASADVEKMVLGNKCDINDKRQVSKDKGEKVSSMVVEICCHFVINVLIGAIYRDDGMELWSSLEGWRSLNCDLSSM